MFQTLPQNSSVAVIGGGVAGIVASFMISQNHKVTLFEGADYLGGHTHTVVLPSGTDAGKGIDTGFIVLNDQTYPFFQRFLQRLNVPVRYTDMSFSYYCETENFVYGSRNLQHLFCQPSNLVRPMFYKMMLGVAKFWKVAEKAHTEGTLLGMTLGEFLQKHQIPEVTTRHYILPMAGAIWSSPAEEMSAASAESIIHFFKNHGLLGYRNQPRWQTVVGASHAYVHAFKRAFEGEILLKAQITKVERSASGVKVYSVDGTTRSFDYVVIAVHADHVLKVLAEPSAEEKSLFEPWRYKRNRTVLHTDIRHLPPNRRAWASWNYRREKSRLNQGGVPITYNMNILQGLELSETYCVTLNPEREIMAKRVIKEIDYTHPVFSTAAIESQKLLNQHKGAERTFFCGSYHGFGFHEDAVRSAVRVAQYFSGKL